MRRLVASSNAGRWRHGFTDATGAVRFIGIAAGDEIDAMHFRPKELAELIRRGLVLEVEVEVPEPEKPDAPPPAPILTPEPPRPGPKQKGRL